MARPPRDPFQACSQYIIETGEPLTFAEAASVGLQVVPGSSTDVGLQNQQTLGKKW